MHKQRHLALVAGPFRLAVPLTSVRQIVDVGGDGEAPVEATIEGARALSLARVLGEEPLPFRPARLLLDGPEGPVLLSCCKLEGVFEAGAPAPLPATVAMRWPGLVQGVLVREAEGEEQASLTTLLLALDPRVLLGIVEIEASSSTSGAAEAG